VSAVCLCSTPRPRQRRFRRLYGHRPAFWPQGQLLTNHTPSSRLIRASFASRFADEHRIIVFSRAAPIGGTGVSWRGGFHRKVCSRERRQTVQPRALPAQEGRRGDPQMGGPRSLPGATCGNFRTRPLDRPRQAGVGSPPSPPARSAPGPHPPPTGGLSSPLPSARGGYYVVPGISHFGTVRPTILRRNPRRRTCGGEFREPSRWTP
jgi:hypothetical protein